MSDHLRALEHRRTLDEAQALMHDAYEAERAAQAQAVKCEAEWLRLALLETLDKHPTIEGFQFTREFVYDDEGRYLDTIDLRPQYDFALLGDEETDPEDEVQELGPSIAACQIVMETADEWGGSITKDALLGRAPIT